MNNKGLQKATNKKNKAFLAIKWNGKSWKGKSPLRGFIDLFCTLTDEWNYLWSIKSYVQHKEYGLKIKINYILKSEHSDYSFLQSSAMPKYLTILFFCIKQDLL